MANNAERENVWSIVLAGGDGVRTKEFIRRWLGYEKPKQYCTFVGSRSMFQHTLDQFQARAFESLEQHGGVDPVAYEKLGGYLSRPLKSWSSSNSSVRP